MRGALSDLNFTTRASAAGVATFIKNACATAWQLGSGAPPRINLQCLFLFKLFTFQYDFTDSDLEDHYLLFAPEFWTSLSLLTTRASAAGVADKVNYLAAD